MNTTVLENRISQLTTALMHLGAEGNKEVHVGDWFHVTESICVPLQRCEVGQQIVLEEGDRVKVVGLHICQDETFACGCKVWYGKNETDIITISVGTVRELLFNGTFERTDAKLEWDDDDRPEDE